MQSQDSLWIKKVKDHQYHFKLTSADYWNIEGKDYLDKIHKLLKSKQYKECFLCDLNLGRNIED